MKQAILKEAFGAGKHDYYAEYHGNRNRPLHDIEWVLHRLLTELDPEADYHEIWDLINDEARKGREAGKKAIAKERRENNQRIARMKAEAELKEKGFGQ